MHLRLIPDDFSPLLTGVRQYAVLMTLLTALDDAVANPKFGLSDRASLTVVTSGRDYVGED